MYQGKFTKSKNSGRTGKTPQRKPAVQTASQKPAAPTAPVRNTGEQKPVRQTSAEPKTPQKQATPRRQQSSAKVVSAQHRSPGASSNRQARALQKRRKKIGNIVFYSILLTFIAAFVIAMFFVMGALRNWLVRFEASQPTVKCEEVFSQLFRTPDWQEIHALAGDQASDIPAEDYASYMEEKVGDTQLTYIETSAGLSGDKKYIVRCGSEKVASFTLCNNAPDADIPDWQLGDVEIFFQRSLDVTVFADPAYTVLINGAEVSDSNVVRTVTTKAENYLPLDYHGYRINEIYATDFLTEPQVTVQDADGSEVELEYDSATRTYRCKVTPQEISEQQRQALTDAATTYCKYMIGAASARQLSKCFNSRSDIYKTITTNTTWMQNYAGYELGDVQIEDYYSYCDQLYSARVRLKLLVTRKDGSVKEYELDNTFFMEANADDDYLVTEMINANAQDRITFVRLTYIDGGKTVSSELVDANRTTVSTPAVSVPDGKTFTGWFKEVQGTDGSKTMELVFKPLADGTVRLAAGTELEPMTLYALYE